MLLQSYRRRNKLKRSLVSRSSLASVSSIFNTTSVDVVNQTIDLHASLLKQMPHDPIVFSDLEQLNDFNLNDEEISNDDSSSTATYNDSECDDLPDDLEFEHSQISSDYRPVHSYTPLTVREFSLDMMEFCRVSRLPKNQRFHLLEMFRKYLPSPNLVPISCDALSGK